MWTRKSDIEIELEKRRLYRARFNPLRPFALMFFVVIVVGLGGVIARLAGYRHWREGVWTDAYPLDQWMPRIAAVFPGLILLALILGVIAYVIQICFGDIMLKLNSTPTLLCTTCFKARSIIDTNKCECGGTAEPLEKWKWADDRANGATEDAKYNETSGIAPPNCTYDERIKYYTLSDLESVQRRIDKKQFPDRYQLVTQEIEKRMKEMPTMNLR